MNELRAVIFAIALFGMAICCLIGIDQADNGDAESIKGCIMAGFAMLSAATLAAGALNGLGRGPSKARPVNPGVPAQVPYQQYQQYGQPGQPYGAPAPPPPGQSSPGRPQ